MEQSGIFGGIFGGIEPIIEFIEDRASDLVILSGGCDATKAGF